MPSIFRALADTLDFRDQLFAPSLVEVPTEIRLEEHLAKGLPVLDQKDEWSCTGHALATVAHYLLRTRKVSPDTTEVSPRMLYEMAKRFDDYSGVRYQGSSSRGAMKGWHKFGVCSKELWPYRSNAKTPDRRLTEARARDARLRPLGAYFRVNHRDLVAMHSALAEVGILYAVASVHQGWIAPRTDGVIRRGAKIPSAHAFAIVAYDRGGFWIQNSAGTKWGRGGFGYITYDDWLEDGRDVWVARLGVPVSLGIKAATATAASPMFDGAVGASAVSDLRHHIINVSDDGGARASSTFGTSEEDIEQIIRHDIPAITKGWKSKRRRVLLFVDSSLHSEGRAIQRVADYRDALLEKEIYPLAIVWRTDLWREVSDLLVDAAQRRTREGGVGDETDFMIDRLSNSLEPLVRRYGGRMTWEDWKQSAIAASGDRDSAGRLLLGELAKLHRKGNISLHVAAHGPGAILLAPLVAMLTSRGRITSGRFKGRPGFNVPLDSCTLWAPACTTELFDSTYRMAIEARRIRRFRLFTLTEAAERADTCGGVYRHSLLYLISNALESRMRVPSLVAAEPLLGLARSIENDEDLKKLLTRPPCKWVTSPNTRHEKESHSSARHHGDFDDDQPTLLALLATILQSKDPGANFAIRRSASSMKRLRQQIFN